MTDTIAVALINVCWLLPLALLVALGVVEGILGVIISYAPLVGMALWLQAGRHGPERATTTLSGQS